MAWEIYQEKSKRHGLSWCFDWQEPRRKNGTRPRHRKSEFRSKASAEMHLANIKLRVQREHLGIAPPEAPKQTTIGEATDRYIEILTARWDGERGTDYAKKNVGQLNALRRWAESMGRDRRVDTFKD